jgi:hypothetical protein
MGPDLDKLVTIDILCRKVKVTIKSVSLRSGLRNCSVRLME